MNELARVHLVRSVACLAAVKTRPTAISELIACLDIEGVLFFMPDSGQNAAMLPAPGFSIGHTDGPLWRKFFTDSLGNAFHRADLPFPESDALKTVTGLAWENRAVLALVGTTPARDVLEELMLLLPLLASALLRERDLTEGRPDALRDRTAKETLEAVTSELAQTKLELASTRQQLAAATAAKDDFLAAVSHELRTPLNPMLLIASEASENPKLTSAVRRDFATIARNAEIEGRLIDDLTDITRIAQGKMSLDKRSVDLRSVLEDAIATVRARLDTRKIKFVTALEPQPHSVFGDAARLQQVFWNLLKIAVKAAPTGGQIRIETQVDGKARQIVVTLSSSSSSGAPPGTDHAFDSSWPQENGGSAPPHRNRGLGVGIEISRMLVELHAGTIEAASAAAPGHGVFTVRLPLSTPGATGNTVPPLALAPSEPPSKSAGASAQVRVLLVEDHEPTSIVLARLLKRRNFDVVVAASMTKALNAAEAATFDLVISDIGLPDGDGYSLMTALQKRHRLPGIAVTGYGMQEDIARSEAAGFMAHITKPISVRALEAALDIVLPSIAGKK